MRAPCAQPTWGEEIIRSTPAAPSGCSKGSVTAMWGRASAPSLSSPPLPRTKQRSEPVPLTGAASVCMHVLAAAMDVERGVSPAHVLL